jgi:hypothetical protein
MPEAMTALETPLRGAVSGVVGPKTGCGQSPTEGATLVVNPRSIAISDEDGARAVGPSGKQRFRKRPEAGRRV